jgi:hypothetical protein
VTPLHGQLLPPVRNREELFDYLEGYAVERGGELLTAAPSRSLTKTYMLETVAAHRPRPADVELFSGPGRWLEPLDDGLFLLSDERLGARVAAVEMVGDRHPVLYTQLQTQQSDPYVRRLIDASPFLDCLWLSAPVFSVLWSHVQRTTNPARFTKLTFEHEAFYDADLQRADDDGDGDAQVDAETVTDRRASRFSVVDRIRTVADRLPELTEAYRPLHSITQLRVPGVTAGGHDFYYDGKVTNRSDSFIDHRQNVLFVLDLYRRATEEAERSLWTGTDAVADGAGLRLRGAPVLLSFSEPLDEVTFDRWLNDAFGRRRNRFRTAGYVTRLGPTKAHVAAVDRHLWQPFLLEATARQLLLVLPDGTCGNTVHRLVTNVQRWLDPGVTTWLGERPFGDLIDATLQASSGPGGPGGPGGPDG